MAKKNTAKKSTENQEESQPIDTTSPAVVSTDTFSSLNIPLIVVSVLVILMLLILGGLYISRNSQDDTPAPVAVDLEQIEIEADRLEASGDYKGAIEVFDAAAENSSGEELADIYALQATIAHKNKDYELALDYISKSVDVHAKIASLTLAGTVANQLNETDQAIAYYRDALDLMETQEIRDEMEEQAVKDIIGELERTGEN